MVIFALFTLLFFGMGELYAMGMLYASLGCISQSPLIFAPDDKLGSQFTWWKLCVRYIVIYSSSSLALINSAGMLWTTGAFVSSSLFSVPLTKLDHPYFRHPLLIPSFWWSIVPIEFFQISLLPFDRFQLPEAQPNSAIMQEIFKKKTNTEQRIVPALPCYTQLLKIEKYLSILFFVATKVAF